MDWLPIALVWLLVIVGVGWFSVKWGPRGRARRRDRKRLARQQAWADSGEWPPDWKEFYPTHWEYGQDYPRMLALGFQAERDWMEDGGHYVLWLHRQLREAVERAGSLPSPPLARR
jgi:hypothetical protein